MWGCVDVLMKYASIKFYKKSAHWAESKCRGDWCEDVMMWLKFLKQPWLFTAIPSKEN